eukprot:6188720-Pleurochrysis_carterae.AAC.2
MYVIICVGIYNRQQFPKATHQSFAFSRIVMFGDVEHVDPGQSMVYAEIPCQTTKLDRLLASSRTKGQNFVFESANLQIVSWLIRCHASEPKRTTIPKQPLLR